MRILSLNSGSSSLKFSVYDVESGETLLADGAAENLGTPTARFWLRAGDGRSLLDEPRPRSDIRGAVAAVWEVLQQHRLGAPAAVGHRLVFGGVAHAGPARLDQSLLADLRALTRFAPLHMPGELAAVEAAMRHAPGVPHVACFDTAFHRRMPQIAQRLPLPREFWDQGLRRFGYHGLSYEFIVATAGGAALGRCVIAHLGHGASLAAVRDGLPVETTMGFSPSGGLIMSTRSGDLDPGVLIHLAREHGLAPDDLERLVTREAGLRGISGTSGDMRELLGRRGTDARADEAVAMFCRQARKEIGALAACLGGLDTLVFTGGIGEHAAPVRWEICDGLAHLGVRLDRDLNDRHAGTIGVPGEACDVRVIPTNENLMIARHTHALSKGAT